MRIFFKGYFGQLIMKSGKSDFLINCTRVLLHLYLNSAYDFSVLNREKIPNKGPSVIVMKHQSWVDTLVAGLITPRPAYFMGKYELFENLFGDFPGTLFCSFGKFISPFTSWLLGRGGVIPLDRENPSRIISSFKFMKKILKEGEYLVFYPEGRVIKDRMGEFKSGLIRLVLRFQKKSKIRIQFVPVGISYEKQKFFRKKLTVKIGDIMEFEWNDDDATEKLKSEIEKLTDFDI